MNKAIDIFWGVVLGCGFFAAIGCLMLAVSLTLATVLQWNDDRRARPVVAQKLADERAHAELAKATRAAQAKALADHTDRELEEVTWVADDHIFCKQWGIAL